MPWLTVHGGHLSPYGNLPWTLSHNEMFLHIETSLKENHNAADDAEDANVSRETHLSVFRC